MGWGRPEGWCRAALAGGVLVLAAAAPSDRAAAAAPSDGAQPGDPALSVDPAAVQRAMVCRGPVGGAGREPVLLVHGTFVTGGETFGSNHLPGLAARGHRVCTVDLPNRSTSDIQVAAEHVVVAVHRLARETGRKVDVIGHSQGVLQARWAVRWWPSVRAEVDDLVSLAGPNQGTTVAASPLTPLLGCAACLQMAPGSAFLTALNAGDQTPGEVSYTALYSTLVDELITPNATAARMEGASNIELQALCPVRPVTHITILADAVAFSLVVDALASNGPSSPSRFNPATCLQVTPFGVPAALSGVAALLVPPAVPTLGTIPAVEPPLQPYARPRPARGAATSATRPAPVVMRAPEVRPAAGTVAVASTPAVPAPAAAQAPAAPAADLPARTAAATGPSEERLLPLLALLALAVTAGATGGVAVRRSRLG